MKKKYIYAFATLLALSVSSCGELEDFGDTNVNPGTTNEPVIGALMTNAQASIGGYAYMVRPGYYAQYFSQTQYTDESRYSNPQISFTGEYNGVLYDLQNVINLNQSNNMTQIARILQQYVFWTITDRWGDVPYSEALKGIEFSRPKYDTQEEIYKGMISTLTNAVASFDNSAVTGDVIFSGDIAAWKRTANSLRMLMALQLSERFPGANEYAATEFKAALNDPAGYISTNAQNFKVAYPGGNFPSSYWSQYATRQDNAESQTMTTLMSSLNDARQNAYGGSATEEGTTGSSNVGVPYGVARETAEAFTRVNTNWARILRGNLRNQSSPVFVVSAAQVALARAEAAHYGWTSENVTTVYNQGITLSYEQWGTTLPANYLTQSSVALAGGTGTASDFRKIAIQRYIASYPDGLQGWNIWRKTGYPELSPAPAASNSSKQIPRRYVYAATEATTNEANYNAAVAKLQGGNVMDARVWWDKQ